MGNIRDKNKIDEALITNRKKTTMPPEIFQGEAQDRKQELLKLLRVRKDKPLKLSVVSIYKDKESYSNSDYKEREFYNHRNELVATYKENPVNYNAFVEGYLKAFDDNGIEYEINEEVCVD